MGILSDSGVRTRANILGIVVVLVVIASLWRFLLLAATIATGLAILLRQDVRSRLLGLHRVALTCIIGGWIYLIAALAVPLPGLVNLAMLCVFSVGLAASLDTKVITDSALAIRQSFATPARDDGLRKVRRPSLMGWLRGDDERQPIRTGRAMQCYRSRTHIGMTLENEYTERIGEHVWHVQQVHCTHCNARAEGRWCEHCGAHS